MSEEVPVREEERECDFVGGFWGDEEEVEVPACLGGSGWLAVLLPVSER